MIQFQHVEKRYAPRRSALNDINLKIHKGEFVLLCGANGAGKSTLLKLIYREEEPTSVKVLFEGQNINNFNSRAVARLRCRLGLVFQEFKLLANLSGLENVSLAAEIAGLTKSAARSRAEQLLRGLGLTSQQDANPSSLSGGEQQRIAIARALINRPSLILADEPTGNLDDAAARETLQLFKAIQQQDSTVIVASHAVELFKPVATRVVQLEKGRIVADSAGSVPAEWRL
jgi:cell division transport system ATP-binding protein